MKWLVVMAAAAGCGGESPPCNPAVTNLCVTFETGMLPNGWRVVQSGSATGELSSARSHTGDTALHVTASVVSGTQWSLETEQIPAPGIVHVNIHAFVLVPALPTAEVTLLSSADAAMPHLDLRLEPDGNLIDVAGGVLINGTLLHPGQWTAIDAQAVYSDTTMTKRTVSFGVLADGTGDPFEVWFDDVLVQPDISS